jgi:TAP42-like family
MCRRLFSPIGNLAQYGCCRNEDKDDLATPDLKYLAVPYLQGEIAARGAATDMQACNM